MKISSPPVVYLDSQDYSRFGDVLRGKADSATESLFESLEARKQGGDVIFAVSMPILSELLQYNSNFRETTIRKAEAVDRLCGKWALAYPSRLVAAEIATEVNARGLASVSMPPPVLSDNRYWYPNISDTFADLEKRFKGDLDAHMASTSFPSRAIRRAAHSRFRKLNIPRMASAAAPLLADKYGLPKEAITGSIVALLRGKTTPAEASECFFGAIAKPQNFVETYFERTNNEKSLPDWMKNFGNSFEKIFTQMRDNILELKKIDDVDHYIDSFVSSQSSRLHNVILDFGRSDFLECGINKNIEEIIKGSSDFLEHVPSCNIFSRIIPGYIRQIAGMEGGAAKVERSFGGDVIHALYAKHVHLWRGDRRFSHLLKKTNPDLSEKVVSKLSELPAAIDNFS